MDDEQAFRSFLLLCFEEAISHILGESIEKALLERIEKDSGLKPYELIGRIDVLKSCLERIFGRGALVLERIIAKKIYSKLNMDMPFQDLEVVIEQAKQTYMKTAQTLFVTQAVKWTPTERNRLT